MKKVLLYLLILPLFVSCSSDDDDSQDYTSFVFIQTIDNELPNCVAAYKKDGKYYKIGDLGTLKTKNQSSLEIRINDESINEIFFFTDYNGTVRFDEIYRLKKNTKNIFKLLESTGGIRISDRDDPSQYPQ